MSLTNIVEGWYNYIKGTSYIKRLMKNRLEICNECPELVEVSKLGQVLPKLLNLEDSLFKCNKCGCPIGPKTASTKESCPLKKWGVAGTEDFY